MKTVVARLELDSSDDEADWEMPDGGLKSEESEFAFNLTVL